VPKSKEVTVYAAQTTSITLTFEQPSQIELTLTISAMTGGTTSPSPGTYKSAKDSEINVVAIASQGYAFQYWMLDGIMRTENPLTVKMNTDHTLTAYFTQTTPHIDDIIEKIRQFLNNPTIRNFMFFGGCGLVLIGGVMLIFGGHKPQYYYYYY
jgi:hypothetical protein